MVTCETEYTSQVYKGDNGMVDVTPKNGKLPIVVLSPFVKKSWRRERSLASFYVENHNVKMFSMTGDITKSAESPREKVYRVIEPNKKEDDLKRSADLKTKKTEPHFLNLGTDRVFNKIHPLAKSIVQYAHAQSFQTPFDRFRCTRVNNFMGKTSVREPVLQEHAVTDEDSTSEKRPGNNLKRKPFSYLDTCSHYNRIVGDHCRKIADWKRSHSSIKPNEDVTLSSKPHSVVGIYDEFDRNGSLPSIYVRHASPKMARSQEALDKVDHSVGEHITASSNEKTRIKNSLEILRETGPPVAIEHYVTNELTQTLSHIRRSQFMVNTNCTSEQSFTPKNFANVSINYRSGPTNGEMLLKKGLESNSKRRKIKVAVKSTSEANEVTAANLDYRDSGIQSPVEYEDESSVQIVAKNDDFVDISRDPIAMALMHAEDHVTPDRRVKLPDCVFTCNSDKPR